MLKWPLQHPSASLALLVFLLSLTLSREFDLSSNAKSGVGICERGCSRGSNLRRPWGWLLHETDGMEHGERLFDLSLRGGLSKKKEGGDQRKDAGGKIFMKEGRVGKPQKDLGQRAKKKKVAVDSKDVAEQRVEDIKEEDSVTIVTKARNGVIEWENGVVAAKGQAINDRAEKEKHKAAHTEEETKKRKKEGNEWWGGEVGQEPLIGAVDGGIILPETSGIDISDGDWGSDVSSTCPSPARLLHESKGWNVVSPV